MWYNVSAILPLLLIPSWASVIDLFWGRIAQTPPLPLQVRAQLSTSLAISRYILTTDKQEMQNAFQKNMCSRISNWMLGRERTGN